MAGRQLSGLDVAFLCLEGESTPMHMGAVVIFDPGEPVDPEKIAKLLAERATRIPRLRQRVSPGLLPGAANWTDDPLFDPHEHIDTCELHEFYEEDPLAAHAAEWIEQPLDLARPLWQVRVVNGLPGNRFALLLKLHHAFTDGAGAFAVAAGLIDELPITKALLNKTETPPRPRSPLTLLKETLSDGKQTAGIATSILRAARPYPFSPLSAPSSTSRRLGFVRLEETELRQVRAAHGGTTNDVILAVLAGALRQWMVNRGQRVDGKRLRALIPVSTRARESGGANRLSGYLCELPVHIDDPVERLRAVRREMNRHKAVGTQAGAGAVPVLADRMPPPLHKLATRAAGQASGLLFDTVITNVPLPKLDLTLDGAPLREVYPLVPLAPRNALGIAAAVFHDGVHIGLQANGAAVPDTGSLRDAVLKSAAALYERSV
ncbi:wax ester/triacylglycerol synthase family O-acyltransferase [Amycolatopsis acidicola]|uniref:Diacylglycerol O-acyltransferase n=1 Tax=Amycolatopsis acidicola TaxID=2596893 RepID=A0A5N0V3N6_9PSEU|nr:wax ester/triacylglycerol synthase family O-acyltransferase [Amycolatopsis acidicola]KAA9159998.1 wax ester/triacylglycerol synthase family O-acyltransferase [Amycolatopsis acidicola]